MKKLATVLSTLVLAGCVNHNTQTQWDMNRQNSPAPGIAKSPLDEALFCVKYNRIQPELIPKIGVGTIGNATGIFDYEGAGNYLPVDAGHMFTTALKDAGFRVVIREGSTMQMAEWELNYAMKKMISDGRMNYYFDPSIGKEGRDVEVPYRIVKTATLLGSDLLLVGSINRLDFDTSSGGLEVFVNGYEIGRRSYSALVGMDLALVDTETTEVIWAEQYSKEYFGLENKAGVFKFEGNNNLIDVNYGVESNDPLHAGLTDMVMFAAFDMGRTLYNLDGKCDSHLDRNHNFKLKDTARRAPAGFKTGEEIKTSP